MALGPLAWLTPHLISEPCTVHIIHNAPCTVHIIYSAPCTVHIIQRTLYSTHYTQRILYNTHYIPRTLYSTHYIQRTLYIKYSFWYSKAAIKQLLSIDLLDIFDIISRIQEKGLAYPPPLIKNFWDYI